MLSSLPQGGTCDSTSLNEAMLDKQQKNDVGLSGLLSRAIVPTV